MNSDFSIPEVEAQLKKARAIVDRLEVVRSVLYSIKAETLMSSGTKEEVANFIQGLLRD